MGYETIISAGYGIEIMDTSAFESLKNGHLPVNDVIYDIIEEYPLLGFEISGDTRIGGDPVIIIGDTMKVGERGMIIDVDTALATKDLDPLAVTQLQEFITKYDLMKIPTFLVWSTLL